MTIDQLGIYNGALRECEERKLASLTEAREPRFLLDDVWGDGGQTSGGLKYCLEEALWGFAIRSAQADYDPNFTPGYGFLYRFQQPPDFIKTASVCVDDHFDEPLTQYADEAGVWYADLMTIFVKYVSNDPAYGLNYAAWPESFVEFVKMYFARQIIGKLTKNQQLKDNVNKKYEYAAKVARSRAAMEQPAKFPPQGLLVKARLGFWSRGQWRRSG